MIRINLIPVKEKKKRRELFIVFCVVIVLVLIAFGMAWVYGSRMSEKNNLNKKIKQVEDESKEYEEKINEEKDLEAKEASLETFKKTVKGVTDTQRKVLVAMDQLALNLPEGVWLTKVSQGRDKDSDLYTVEGYSYSAHDLQIYLNSLRKPGGMFKDVQLITTDNILSLAGNKFKITTRVMDTNS